MSKREYVFGSKPHDFTAAIQESVLQVGKIKTPPTLSRSEPAPSASSQTESISTLAEQPVQRPALGSQSPAFPCPDWDNEARVIDCGDRTVNLLLRLEHPPLALFDNFLSGDECDALLELAKSRMTRSLAVETSTGGSALHPDRTSRGMFFGRGESDLVQRIEDRIARLLRWPAENGEGIQVLHYAHGCEYKPHYDYFDPSLSGTPALTARGGQRVATLLLSLSPPSRGGGTVFPDLGLNVTPLRGQALYFGYNRPHPDSLSLHGGSPVLDGEKWVATKWLREREFR